ncbi:MAG: hypothetical protein IJZ81_04630 [Clostridia bacterium]|nr:hypothetical protein [Clostridia bacterium]
MKKICILFIVVLLATVNTAVFAYEDTPVNLLVNGRAVSFPFSPVIRDGVTYVDAQTLCTALGLGYKTYEGHDSVIISNLRLSICLSPEEEFATVADLSGTSDSEYSYKMLTAPCIYIGNRFAVAARDLASVFGYALSFDTESNTVYFGYAPQMISQATRDAISQRAYYFQNSDMFSLPSFGSGYCWTCSYAMVLTNLTGREITPLDVSEVNYQMSGDGAYCYHPQIIKEFGIEFASALSPDSQYYAGRTSDAAEGTYIKNPQKDDNIVRQALKEALTLHPEGVMVRYANFPHTMVAVAYDGDIILFNDPAPSASYEYTQEGCYRGVVFSETCVAKKGFTLSDVTFIQAID